MQDTMTPVKEHRYDIRKTAKKVAEESGIDLAVYSRIENGVQKLRVDHAVKLERVFDIPWNVLIEESYPELFKTKK